MWTRKELKDRAKITLKANYWKAVLVSLILSFLTGGGGSSAGNSASESYKSASGGASLFSGVDPNVLAAVLSAIVVAVLVILAISFVLSLLVFNPLIVGCRRFFIKCREEQPSLRAGFCFFKLLWEYHQDYVSRGIIHILMVSPIYHSGYYQDL